MDAQQFQGHVDNIEATILEAIEGYMQRHKLPWRRKDFLEQTTVNLEDMAHETLFYGAETFPVA